MSHMKIFMRVNPKSSHHKGEDYFFNFISVWDDGCSLTYCDGCSLTYFMGYITHIIILYPYTVLYVYYTSIKLEEKCLVLIS